MASKFAKLANATLTFKRVLSTKIDPRTGNEIPDAIETYETRAYIKREKEDRVKSRDDDPTPGVPVGSYKCQGYTVETMPDWCRNPIDPKVPCSIDNLGSGYFYFEGKIHVVYDKISAKGQTTPIQGYFTLQGSGV